LPNCGYFKGDKECQFTAAFDEEQATIQERSTTHNIYARSIEKIHTT